MTSERDAKLLLLLKQSQNTPLAILAGLKLIEKELKEEIQKFASAVHDGRDGRDGKNGTDGKDGLKAKNGKDGRDGKDGGDGKQGKEGKEGKQGKTGKQGLKGLRGLRGLQGKKGKDGNDGKDGLDGSPDTGQDIVEKINNLPINPSVQIDASHIKNMTQLVLGGRGISRSLIRALIADADVVDDLSSQCDGSNKVFTLAEDAAEDTITLESTDFPLTYRPTVDFTQTAKNEITLSASATVPAPNTGATLIARYDKT